MSGKRTIKPDVEMAILADYETMRASDIAIKYGINRKTVSIVVRRNGGTVKDQRSSSGRPLIPETAYREDVIRLRKQGLSQQAIAKRVGISQAVVGRTLRGAGFPTVEKRTAERSNNWKGGVTKSSGGYLAQYVQPDDEMAAMRSKTGYVLQHRLIMARALGRPLRDYETVHHVNGDRKDNRLENLQLRFGLHGRGARFKCASCGSYDVQACEIGED
jgi:predicted DNA-binding protein (UPF0251 family)